MIWKSGRIPEEWKTSVIVSLFKKRDQEKTENYREISLLCTAYKIYAELLRQRLEEEIERKELLPESQRGFRKGRGVLDNVFVLSHMVQREKKDKVYALFVDLRAAFDKVVKEKLWEVLEEKRIKEKIIRRVKMIYEETKVVRTKERMTNSFIIKKGVRQGCVLIPVLFNMYIADIDKYMKEKGIDRVSIDKEGVSSLAYANDMVIVAKNRDALMGMMEALRKFIKKNGFELNTEKTKVLTFNKKGKRKRKYGNGRKRR